MTPTRREYCWKCRGMVTAEETGADDAYKCPYCGEITREPREDSGESKRKVTSPTTGEYGATARVRRAAGMKSGRMASQ